MKNILYNNLTIYLARRAEVQNGSIPHTVQKEHVLTWLFLYDLPGTNCLLFSVIRIRYYLLETENSYTIVKTWNLERNAKFFQGAG